MIYSNKFRNLETAVKKYVYSDEKHADTMDIIQEVGTQLKKTVKES